MSVRNEHTTRKLFRDRGHWHTRMLGFLCWEMKGWTRGHGKNGLYPYACFECIISILLGVLLPKSLPVVIGYVRCGIFRIDLSNLNLVEHEGSFLVQAIHLQSFLPEYPFDVILLKYLCRHLWRRRNPGFHGWSHQFLWFSVVCILNRFQS